MACKSLLSEKYRGSEDNSDSTVYLLFQFHKESWIMEAMSLLIHLLEQAIEPPDSSIIVSPSRFAALDSFPDQSVATLL